MSPSKRRFYALVSAGVLLAAIGSSASPAHAADIDCTQFGTTQLQGGEYIYQQNEWNSTARQCAEIDPATGAWSITEANFNLPTNGAPATYPSSFKGCHWGLCTSNSGLPIQVSNLATATTSWSTVQPASGAYNAAYDLWFNSTPTTGGQPDGTELMIWMNSRGGVQPFGEIVGTADLAGHTWDVWTGQQSSWKIISYVLHGGGTSFSSLDVNALIEDGTARGSIDPAHYLITAEAGFEIWQGGQGVATNSFSFSATPQDGDPDTTPPSTPSNLTVTGTTSSSVSLSWSASTDDVGVTGYDVYRNGALAGTTSSTSFTDTGLSPAVEYSYVVTARDAAGNVSPNSNEVTATTDGEPDPDPGEFGLSLQAVSPNPTSPGTATNVTVDFTNRSSQAADDMTLTITIVNEVGTVVGSQSWTGQNLAPNQTLNETHTWMAASAPGAYTVEASVRDSSGTVVGQADNLGTITVT